MKNIYELKAAKISKVVTENTTTKTLFLKLEDQNNFQFLAGQFMMIGLPGFGECPISISSNPKKAEKGFTLTIRAVGNLTKKLILLKKGEVAWVRGPFGNGFPEPQKNLIVIGGGCGYVPLRSVIEENKDRKDIKMQVFVGCKNKDSLVFQSDYERMKSKLDFNLIMEEEKLPGFSREIGFVTDLIKKKKLIKDAQVFVCGPEPMYKFVVRELIAKGVEEKNIYLSLEKKMYCGHGVCQHCAVGTKYVCKDGPVFSYEFLKTISNYKYTK